MATTLTHLETTVLIGLLLLIGTLLIVTSRDTALGETILLAVVTYVLARSVVQVVGSTLDGSLHPALSNANSAVGKHQRLRGILVEIAKAV